MESGENQVEADEFNLLNEAREILDSKGHNSKFSDDLLICECMCLSAGDIRKCLKENVVDLNLLTCELKLGSGCSSCLKSFHSWKEGI